MKKILYAILAILIVASCTPLERSIYRCEISYSIGNSDTVYSDVVSLEMPSECVPSYAESQGKLIITAYPSNNYGFFRSVVYEGTKVVRVHNFHYTLAREYKASKITGRELKRK